MLFLIVVYKVTDCSVVMVCVVVVNCFVRSSYCWSMNEVCSKLDFLFTFVLLFSCLYSCLNL